MKKSIDLLVLVAITFALFVFGCGKKQASAKYTIGFSQCNSAEPWREAMNKEIMEEASKHPELNIVISDGQQDNSKQVADVENFIVQEVDLLIISPNEAQPLTMVVEKAFDTVTKGKMDTNMELFDAKYLWDFYKDKDQYEFHSLFLDHDYLYSPPLEEYGGAWVLVSETGSYKPFHNDLKFPGWRGHL